MLNVSNLIDDYFSYVRMYSLAPAEPLPAIKSFDCRSTNPTSMFEVVRYI
jgi:hypothetical protein